MAFPAIPVSRDPILQRSRLRSDPRFTALLADMKTRWEEYRGKFGRTGLATTAS